MCLARASRRLAMLAVCAATILATTLFVSPQPASAASPADHVLFWNDVLLRTFRQIPGPPQDGVGLRGHVRPDADLQVLLVLTHPQHLPDAHRPADEQWLLVRAPPRLEL